MKYEQYILSSDWKKRREWTLIFWGHRCALCFSTKNIEVHHRTYERLGNELITDLIVLCDDCHAKHHGINRTYGTEHISETLARVYTNAKLVRLGKSG